MRVCVKTKNMLQNPKRYTITAALPYTNGPIHIGHLAGVYVPSDIYARYLRLQGKARRGSGVATFIGRDGQPDISK